MLAGLNLSLRSYQARVLEGVKPFKIVAGYDFQKLTFCQIQGEFLQKLTFCTISFRWTNPFLHSGAVKVGSEALCPAAASS